MKSWIIGLAALGLAAAAGTAEAHYVANLEQVGANVVASGSGRLNLIALSLYVAGGPAEPGVTPFPAGISLGAPGSADFYERISGPTSFGPGFGDLADTGSGDIAGLADASGGGFPPVVAVPHGYVSGAALSSSATFDNQTLASLGATPGTYVWTWGQGPSADSFTLNIGAVPEPASWALMLAGIGALGSRLRRRRATAAA